MKHNVVKTHYTLTVVNRTRNTGSHVGTVIIPAMLERRLVLPNAVEFCAYLD